MRATRTTILAGLAALVLLAACAHLGGKHGQRDQLRFSHAKHTSDAVGATCEQCHAGVTASAAGSGRHAPAEKVCLECHDREKEQGGCSFCHSNPQAAAPRPLPEAQLRFGHATHLSRVEGKCERCHPTARTATRLEQLTLPKMESCMSCHRRRYQDLRCGDCHRDLSTLARRDLPHFAHDIGWRQRHGEVSRNDLAPCAQCHDQAYCADCHDVTAPLPPSAKFPEQVRRDLIHRGDFVARHAIEARANPTSCLGCHGQKTCDSCHLLSGVSAAGKVARSPHPTAFMTPGASEFHGRAARRNIAECAACHDQGAASNCVACHRVGGRGGNPHPPGWSSRLDRKQNSMCLICHSR